MATRRTIREAVYDRLVSQLGGTYTIEYDDGDTREVTIDSSHVDLIGPEYTEQTPRVFYQPQTFSHVEYNGVGNAPDEIQRSGETVDYVAWYEFVDGQFFTYVRADDAATAETLYEQLRRAFAVYDSGHLDAVDFHEDVNNIEVVDTSPSNDLGEKPAIWGEQVEVRVEFVRKLIVESGGAQTLPEAVDNLPLIEAIDYELDVDDDGVADFTQTVQ